MRTGKKVFKSYCLLSMLCDLFLFPRGATKSSSRGGATVLSCQLPLLRAEGSKKKFEIMHHMIGLYYQLRLIWQGVGDGLFKM